MLADQTVRSKPSGLTILQFAFSAIAALIALIAAFALFLLGVSQLFVPSFAEMSSDSLRLFMLASSAGFVSLLLLPSAWYALQNLLGNPQRALSPQPAFRNWVIWFVPLPVVLLAGYGVTLLGVPFEYLLPVFQIMAVGLSATFLFALGARNLSIGSRQRFWGVLATGLVLGPIIILMVELILLAFVGIFALVFLVSSPGLLDQLLPLIESGPGSMESAEELFLILQPYLEQPIVFYTALAIVAGLMPLIEEALKPLGVWILNRHRLTPVQGFVAGLLSGAGYGIFESLQITLSGQAWAFLTISRAGTTLLHIFTSGLVGWGLALAFGRGRFRNLALAYLGAVTFHGLWNGLVLISSVSDLYFGGVSVAPVLLSISRFAPFVLMVLVIVMLSLLVYFNRRFTREFPLTDITEYNYAIEQEGNKSENAASLSGDALKETHGLDQSIN